MSRAVDIIKLCRPIISTALDVTEGKKLNEFFQSYDHRCTATIFLWITVCMCLLRNPRADMVLRVINLSRRINTLIHCPDKLINRPDDLLICPDNLLILPDRLINRSTMSARGLRGEIKLCVLTCRMAVKPVRACVDKPLNIWSRTFWRYTGKFLQWCKPVLVSTFLYMLEWRCLCSRPVAESV